MKITKRIVYIAVILILSIGIVFTNANAAEENEYAPEGIEYSIGFKYSMNSYLEDHFLSSRYQYGINTAKATKSDIVNGIYINASDVEENSIVDLSWLSHYPNIEYIMVYRPSGTVYFDWQSVPDKETLKGIELSTYETIYDDLSMVSLFPNLEALLISAPCVISLNGLETATHMKTISLPHSDYRYFDSTQWDAADLASRIDMSKIENITLSNFDLRGLGFFDDCNSLRSVYISCKFDDNMEWAKHNPDLEFLYIAGTSITNLNGFADCSELKSVSLDNCTSLTDISALHGKTKMEQLSICDSAVNDLSVVADMPALWEFSVYRNKTTPSDFNVLANLTNLRRVIIWDNALETIDFLSNSLDIQHLSINDNNIKDISIVANMKSLSFFECHNNPITDFSPLDGMEIRYCRTE